MFRATRASMLLGPLLASSRRCLNEGGWSTSNRSGQFSSRCLVADRFTSKINAVQCLGAASSSKLVLSATRTGQPLGVVEMA